MVIDIPATGWSTEGQGSQLVQNLVWRSGAWSSRVGAEPLPVSSAGLVPSGDGISYPIDGLWSLPSGLYFSASGTLRRVMDEAQQAGLVNLRTGLGDAPQGVVEVPGAVLAFGGDASPVRIDSPAHGWPYGAAAAVLVEDRVQDLLIPTPPMPRVLGVTPKAAQVGVASAEHVSLWHPAQDGAISRSGDYGLGYSTSDKTARFEYAVSYVGPDGSEGPLSPRAGVSWENGSTFSGFRFAVAMDLDPLPPNVVGLKIYRTGNFAADAPFDGDKTLRHVATSYSPDDTQYVDTSTGDNIGAQAPQRAWPAVGRPAAMIVSAGRLWSGRDQLVAYTNTGFTAQYSPSGYVPLPPTIGSVLAMADLDGTPLALGSRGVVALTDQNNVPAPVGVTPTGAGLVSAGAWCPHSGGIVVCTPGAILLIEGSATSGFTLTDLTAPIRSAWAGLSTSGPVYATSSRGSLFVSVPGGDLWILGPQGWSTVTGLDAGPLTTDPDGDVLFGTRTSWGIWCLTQGRYGPGEEPGNDEPYTPGAPLTWTWRSGWVGQGTPTQGAMAIVAVNPTGLNGEDEYRLSTRVIGTGRPPVGGWPSTPTYQGAVTSEGAEAIDAAWDNVDSSRDYWPESTLPTVQVRSAPLTRAVQAACIEASGTMDAGIVTGGVNGNPGGSPR